MIRATLHGSEHATACGITVTGPSPVLRLCRALVDAGHDPSEPLEAYRGSVLCLRVRSIGEAAGLRVSTHGAGFERAPACTVAPLARPSDLAATTLADDPQNESTALCSPDKSRAA